MGFMLLDRDDACVRRLSGIAIGLLKSGSCLKLIPVMLLNSESIGARLLLDNERRNGGIDGCIGGPMLLTPALIDALFARA